MSRPLFCFFGETASCVSQSAIGTPFTISSEQVVEAVLRRDVERGRGGIFGANGRIVVVVGGKVALLEIFVNPDGRRIEDVNRMWICR